MLGFIILCFLSQCSAQLRVVTLVDESLLAAPSWTEEGIIAAQQQNNVSLENAVIKVSIENEAGSEEQFCQAVSAGVAMVLDLTAGGWYYGRDNSEKFGVPYVHGQISIYQWMHAADELLRSRNATDAALIFSEEALLDQALYYLVEGSIVRVIVLTGINANTTQKLKRMRPAPSHYVMFGSPNELSAMFTKAIGSDLVTRDSRWTIVATSPMTSSLQFSVPGSTTVTMVMPTNELCCIAKAEKSPCGTCSGTNVARELAKNCIITSTLALKQSKITNVQLDCSAEGTSAANTDGFYSSLSQELQKWPGVKWNSEKLQITPLLSFDVVAKNASRNIAVGTWSEGSGLELNPNFKNDPIKRYIKIGTIMARPWFYEEKQEIGGDPNEQRYAGYCFELANRLSEKMKFDFDFVFPVDNQYGAKLKNRTWDGMIGDLVRGETDIIVAPLTMTSEREEVVDFVAPYFDQSGISIVLRKREREESLFKFMTVLKAEVWVSIVAALIVTGTMIWFLDKYSPYSAQNNPEMQAQQYRKFTLKESFWFALTSFTPQGGGEAPKALSGRTLVAAYWLFVVLMLATFTANLAAFLTVERMQSPVKSLEALAKQAKITFTTAKDNSVYEYFRNMASAEEELFRVWKQLTLNSSSDQSRYRVWDYPIKEQYTHIKQVIDKTGPVNTAAEGLKKVIDSLDSEFAFIHDAAELRYEVYQDCRLTQIGEPFAEQPYAIAVQQGSHLQDEISSAILDMQKNRYFEALQARFWNSSARGECPNDNDSEGITLQSLGGVFIATLIGLVLALIALAAEVLYYKKIPGSENMDSSLQKPKPKFGTRNISVHPAF